jgi:hypothetical protein
LIPRYPQLHMAGEWRGLAFLQYRPDRNGD